MESRNHVRAAQGFPLRIGKAEELVAAFAQARHHVRASAAMVNSGAVH
jgi:hypothetical protein